MQRDYTISNYRWRCYLYKKETKIYAQYEGKKKVKTLEKDFSRLLQ